MAEVFLAYIEKNGKKKPIAIKRMLPQFKEDMELVEQFMSEGRLLQQLHHPNVVETFELGKVKNSLFIAMEYVFGANLDLLLKGSESQHIKIPLNLLARIGADVCDLLGYIHRFCEQDGTELRYIHRDISPQNIMLSYSGQIKVMDFGVAKDLGTLSRTRPVTLAGKVAYMSPEQVKQAPDLDLRTDIYSLGAVLFELSTGTKPFTALTELDTMLAIVRSPLPDLRDLDNEIPDEFAQIVATAMEKNRQERFQNTAEFRSALDGFLSKRSASVSPKDLAVFIRKVLPPKKKPSTQQHDLQLANKVHQKGPEQNKGEQSGDKETVAPAPGEAVVLLTKKINRESAPQQDKITRDQVKTLDKKIDLSESEMFASIVPSQKRTESMSLVVIAVAVLTACCLAGLVYWFASKPSKEQQKQSSKQVTTQTTNKSKSDTGKKTEAKQNKLPRRRKEEMVNNRADENANHQKTKATSIIPVPGAASVKRTRSRIRQSRSVPEIEIKVEPQDKKPLTNQQNTSKTEKETEGEQDTNTPLSSTPEKAKEAKTDRLTDKKTEKSTTEPERLVIKNEPEPPPKPSYQAPEVVAKRRIAGDDPQYPAIARKAKLRATILVKIHINPDGKVGFMKILKGNPLFNDAVSKAIKTWRFSPYTINGRPVGTYTVYKFVFQIN